MIPPSIYGYLIIAALAVSAFVGTYLKGRFDGRAVATPPR
jgi:ABC-type molybdate transport system permease subunit